MTEQIASPQVKTDFYSHLKREVASYFKQEGISTHANAAMIIKTIAILTIAFGSYALIISNTLPLWLAWLCCITMGIGFAGIGFSVAHDGIHGAYSSNKAVNYILGLSMNLIGGSRYVWSITHNIVHHSYTNIHGVDEDLEIAPFIRLSPHMERKPIHRFQHYFAFIAYGFATIFWVFLKDYKKMFQKDIGPYKNKKHPRSEFVIVLITKLIYYAYTILIPLLIFTWWQWLIGFFTFHFVAGIILGITFQMAHTVEGTDHIEERQPLTPETWAIHQMRTTSNFAMRSPVWTWYMGGLNFQVEHHLFPKICSIHYPAISKIVSKVATEHKVPYHYHSTFAQAIGSHYNFLREMGKA